MKDNIVKIKSKSFAIRIYKLYQYLCIEKKEFVLSKQILRSGTSIGANISESEYSISKKEFISKLHIALKEASETKYWLEFMYDVKLINQKEFENIVNDCDELLKLLTAAIKTLKRK
ncbi:MAG: four helix bundle protein [Endomicrobia bacterium]|nr:four helix bundle protein [Endomicrobiia bacterium]